MRLFEVEGGRTDVITGLAVDVSVLCPPCSSSPPTGPGWGQTGRPQIEHSAGFEATGGADGLAGRRVALRCRGVQEMMAANAQRDRATADSAQRRCGSTSHCAAGTEMPATGPIRPGRAGGDFTLSLPSRHGCPVFTGLARDGRLFLLIWRKWTERT